MSAAPTPKRRNAPQTKAKILAAAQQAFAEQGYPQTGLRDIAAIADVSSTLLLRYYGSKSALFEAALVEAMQVEGVLDDGREGFGRRLAEVLLDPRIEIWPPSMIALSTGDAEARGIATRVIDDQVIGPLAQWLGPPDAQARATQIVMLTMGFVLFSRHFPLSAGKPRQQNKVVHWIAETLQRIVDVS